MKILSLFDGMSVAQQALKNAGIPVEAYYASEIDEYAMAVTQSNFPNTVQLGDVQKFNNGKGIFVKESKLLGPIDLLIGGSPCQDLSIAKKDRKGLAGERSGLFWEYVRIRDENMPEYFILENVASMSQESKDTISKALGVQPVMINASLVSAQNRKRLFWVGERIDTFECLSDGTDNPPINRGKSFYRQVEIPQPKDKGILLKDILENGDADRLKSYCIDASYFKGATWKQYKEKGRRQLVIDKNGKEKLKSNTVRTSGRGSGINDKHNWDTIRIGQIGKGGQAARIYSPEGKSVGLSALGGGGAKTGLYHIPHGFKKEKITEENKYPTLHAQSPSSNHLLVDPIIRKLTPIECLRLQSMPDDYFDKALYKGKPISNTQRYKMCGNAFNCKVIEHILKTIWG